MDWYWNGIEKRVEEMSKTPHEPTLKLVTEKNGKLFLKKVYREKNVLTNEIVKGKKVSDYDYREELFFSPLRKKYDKLTDAEIDTKILKTIYPKLDFNAYSLDLTGAGLDLEGYMRVAGYLYKIE